MRLSYILFVITVLLFLHCTPMVDHRDSVKDIATEAGIPLIQLAYKEANRSVIFELSTVDTIASREDCSTVFQAASLSKPVFAYIVSKMVMSGEMSLDEPIVNYTDIDRFENSEYASMLTARMVLNHITGLPNWAVSPTSTEWPLSAISFMFKPDSAFSYSGEGFSFLQRAVEKIRGKDLEEIAKEEVFIPLGMNHTSYQWLDEYDSLAAYGYNREGVNRGVGRFPSANSAYTLRTTAGDYLKFLTALVDGVGIDKESADRIFTPVVNAVRYPGKPRECDESLFWGLGLGIIKSETLGDVAFHWGDNGNFKALFVISPKVGSSPQKILVYFTNSAHGHDIINKLLPLYFENADFSQLHNWVVE